MKTILITRPSREVESLAALLAAKGFTPFAEPLLRIEPLPENMPLLEAALLHKPQAIIATSKRGVESLTALAATRSIPLLCVGTATAEYAASVGYGNAHECETAQAIPDLVRRHCTPGAYPLLYARGQDISIDITALLEHAGFAVDSVILYRAIAAQAFSASLRSFLTDGNIAGALFFSQRTAEIYATLANQHRLADAHHAMSAVCMSRTVAGKLAGISWRKVHIAKKPDMPHMLEATAAAF